jgi:hypothetical protein
MLKKKQKETKKTYSKKISAKKKLTGKAKLSQKKKTTRKKTLIRERNPFIELVTPLEPRGMGALSGGQSGDIQGLPREAIGNSESEEELIEEGQDREAEILSSVEDVPDADEIRVLPPREVPEVEEQKEIEEKEQEELEVEKAPPEYEEEELKRSRGRRTKKAAGSK